MANDFMDSFFSAFPQAKNGNLSMEELNSLMNDYQQKANSNPLDEFDGLSPNQMSDLLYTPFAEESIIQFRKGLSAYINKAPFFKLSELLLQEIKKAGNLKLTVKGNLPIHICKLLYSQNLIQWPYMEYFKQIREDDIPYLWPLKQYLLDMGIVKKRNNALSLTKNGEQLLKGSAEIRFMKIFDYMASSFHWANFYDLNDEGKCGQLGWAYSLVLLSKYGDQSRKSEFYGLKLIQAFEKDLWDAHLQNIAGNAIRNYVHVYEVRYFECFADWFGLINIERTKDFSISYADQLSITKSELFDQLFEVKDNA